MQNAVSLRDFSSNQIRAVFFTEEEFHQFQKSGTDVRRLPASAKRWWSIGNTQTGPARRAESWVGSASHRSMEIADSMEAGGGWMVPCRRRRRPSRGVGAREGADECPQNGRRSLTRCPSPRPRRQQSQKWRELPERAQGWWPTLDGKEHMSTSGSGRESRTTSKSVLWIVEWLLRNNG